MKKLIIAGSSKLQERAAYWRGYFEGRGYEVIDFPNRISLDGNAVENLTDIYVSFFQNLDRADVFFLMNEDKNDIGGYIGPSAFSELTYAVIANLNHGKKIEINLLQMPSEEQACFEEISFWLEQGWVQIYDRPTGKKAAIPVPSTPVATAPKIEPVADLPAPDLAIDDAPTSTLVPATHAPILPFHSSERSINIRTCKKRCLKHLTPAQREYFAVLCPDFPAWLLKYIAAPEVQRLQGVTSCCGIDQGGLFNFQTNLTIFAHSIGVALIIWRFTHDKKQTLAGLFHDIACPAFHHSVDFMNGDHETQESTEERTSEIIRNSRAICRQLKRDGIMAGEVSDYKLFPIADNATPNLAADRLEYTLANGYFLYNVWSLEDIKRFSDDLTILENENGIAEIGFQSLDLAKAFTEQNLTMSAIYVSDKCRASMQFIADILRSMMLKGYLTLDDLYVMSEREVVDWILSCGDKTLSEAFRQFQRATSIYTGSAARKDRYCVSIKAKMRYIVPLVQAQNEFGNQRITELSSSTARAVQKFLSAKSSKYVGFDFEFKPYSE